MEARMEICIFVAAVSSGAFLTETLELLSASIATGYDAAIPSALPRSISPSSYYRTIIRLIKLAAVRNYSVCPAEKSERKDAAGNVLCMSRARLPRGHPLISLVRVLKGSLVAYET